MMEFPTKAISVRQPWAWAIIEGGKDIENRDWKPRNAGRRFRGRVFIHAAKGMTKDEYTFARDFMWDFHVVCPPPHMLLRGGLIGTVEVIDFVDSFDSPWWMGPGGLVLRDPKPSVYTSIRGNLGFFDWINAEETGVPALMAWMDNFMTL